MQPAPTTLPKWRSTTATMGSIAFLVCSRNQSPSALLNVSCLFLSLSLSLPLSLSSFLPIYIYIYLYESVFLFVYIFIYNSTYLSIFFFRLLYFVSFSFADLPSNAPPLSLSISFRVVWTECRCWHRSIRLCLYHNYSIMGE